MTERELTPEERKARRAAMLAALPGNAPEYDFSYVTPLDDSPLKGARVCLLGSSVAYGSASLQNAVGEYLAARFGFTFRKETVSGTTIADIGENSYISRMKNLISPDEKFDLFICQLGTNDAKHEIPLGNMGEAVPDTGTVTGALEYIVGYVRRTWHCPIVFFTGSRFSGSDFADRYAGMVKRLGQLGAELGFDILDLWNPDGFNDIDDEKRALYMKDNVHPTKAGYRDWWGPELTRQLLRIVRSR